jgi:flagellar operon protein
MANVINGVNVPFIPIVPGEGSQVNKQREVSNSAFNDLFQRELEKLKFSSHASKRLESRNIELNATSMDRLQEAVQKAESKGSKDSLVMMDNTAYIVNIPNRTVVTAMPVEEGGENVFTNIDSVVFAV